MVRIVQKQGLELSTLDTLLGATYDTLMAELVNNFMLALALDFCPAIPRGTICTTEDCLVAAITVLENRCNEIQQPLKFTQHYLSS